MRLHVLKCWPVHYNAIACGLKKTEIRQTYDRDFRVLDLLLLREWNPADKTYTGGQIVVQVTHIDTIVSPGVPLPDGVAALSIEPAEVVPLTQAEIQF